jgi:hypothetical protein
VEVPLTKKVYHVDFIKGRGVSPDFHVQPSIEDIATRTDTELNFALKLIDSQKKKQAADMSLMR